MPFTSTYYSNIAINMEIRRWRYYDNKMLVKGKDNNKWIGLSVVKGWSDDEHDITNVIDNIDNKDNIYIY